MPIETVDKEHFTGGKTEGGITSSYATDDGVKLKVASILSLSLSS